MSLAIPVLEERIRLIEAPSPGHSGLEFGLRSRRIAALARELNWLSHWREMNAQGLRIGRPRQIYTGETARDYVDIDARGE